MYIDKEGNCNIGDIHKCNVLVNANNQRCNVWFHISVKFNVHNNEAKEVSYYLSAFGNKETIGYTRQSFTDFNEAEKAYSDHFAKYNVNNQ